MDDDDLIGWLFKAFFFILFLPFIAVWYAGKYSYLWIVKPAIERSHEESAYRLQDRQLALSTQKDNPDELERARQLKELRDSLPEAPPQRMRAVFAVNKIQVPEGRQKRIRHLIGEDTFVTDYSRR